ncbi:MAG: integrin alpha [Planctomycetota bacterium]
MTLRFIALIALMSPVHAQTVGGGFELQFELNGSFAAETAGLGGAISKVGDINGDGVNDIIVGAPLSSPGGLFQAGAVVVYSGADGTVLYHFIGAEAFDHFGGSVSGLGDINQDGFDEILVGASDANPSGLLRAGSCYIYSGQDGSLLRQWTGEGESDAFGSAVSHAGDLNADGYPDILVGAPSANPNGVVDAGSAYCYSGQNGVLLFQWNGAVSQDFLGSSVSFAGNLNGDLIPDVLIGAYGATSPNVSSPGGAFAFSGASGVEIYRWYGEAYADQMGWSVSGGYDLNNDGFDDCIVGAPGANIGFIYNFGSVFVYSGQDGSLLYRWDGDNEGDFLGASVSGVKDVNGDGMDDIIMGAQSVGNIHRFHIGYAHLRSGRNGALIQKWKGLTSTDAFGLVVADAGDLDTDGFSDIAIASPASVWSGQFGPGSVRLYTINPYLKANTETLSDSSSALISLSLSFPKSAAFYDYQILLSAANTGPTSLGIQIPLGLDNLFVNSYFGNYPFPLSSNLRGRLNANGDAGATFGKLAGTPTGAVGRTFYLAAIANQPGQLPEYSSVAVAIEITP